MSGSVAVTGMPQLPALTATDPVSLKNWANNLVGALQLQQASNRATLSALSAGLGVQGIFVAQTYGAKGDGVTNDYAAITAAIAAAYAAGGGIVWLPPTGAAYLINTGLQLPAGVTLLGARSRNFEGSTATIAQWAANGTWIQSTDTTNSAVSVIGHGVTIAGINFIYAQPIPGVTFTPTAYPYTISIGAGGDFLNIEDVMIIAATHGISINYTTTSGGGTGVNLRNILLSCFIRGFLTYAVNDTICIDNVHVRNMYYDTTASVVSYMERSLIGWDCQYCDNPMVKGLEAFQCSIGILLTDVTVLGNTHSLYNALISDSQVNLGNQAIAGATVNGTASARFVNFLAQQDTDNGLSGALFQLSSDNYDFTFTGVRVPAAGGTVFAIGNGHSGRLVLNDLIIDRYSEVAAGQPAIAVYSGAALVLGNRQITKRSGNGQTMAGAGTNNINTPHNWAWQVWSSPAQFDLTSPSASVFSQSCNVDPIGQGKIQARINGNVNIYTAASGTGSIWLDNFNLVVATFSTSSAGNANFDSGWIDILYAGSNPVGPLILSAPSGARIQSENCSVMFR